MINTGHNSTFAIGGVFPKQVRDKLCSADIPKAIEIVVAENSVLRINPPFGECCKVRHGTPPNR
jgi:hypothetical protein